MNDPIANWFHIYDVKNDAWVAKDGDFDCYDEAAEFLTYDDALLSAKRILAEPEYEGILVILADHGQVEDAES